jgi:hypothetical protein
MIKVTELLPSRRCPKCAGTDVRRSPRRGFLELVVLSSIGVRPFRCQGCANRFYGLKPNGRGSLSRSPGTHEDASLSVLVYGYGANEESFQERANVRLVSMHSAELDLTTQVQPGEKLLLLDPMSEEEQRCNVVSVTARSDGRSVVSVRFRQPVWEFWSAAKFSGGK